MLGGHVCEPASTPLIGIQFETMIAHNLARGYALHSWTLPRVMTGPHSMNETIIAVF